MIYEKQIFEKTTHSGAIYYTGRCLIYKWKIFGIKILPRIVNAVGESCVHFSEINYNWYRFHDKNICEKYLDEFIEKDKIEQIFKNPIKIKQIL